MGTRHDRDELLAGAVDAVLDGGLGELTFGRLAKRLGVADRTLVYYFDNKAGLYEAVLAALADRLVARLVVAFGDERRAPAELLAAAYPVLTEPDSDRIFSLWFQLVGEALGGQEPQRTLATAMMDGWIAWIAELVDASDPAEARQGAIDVLVQLDGALFLHHLGRTEEASRTVARLTE